MIGLAVARLRRGMGRKLGEPHPDRELIAAEFDTAYYLAVNADVARTRVDPIDHFLTFGWREGRDPSLAFSVREYLDAYPDIAQAGINPFAHFLRTGRAEGRAPRHALGFRYEVISQLAPLDERVARALKAEPSSVGGGAQLARALATSRTGLADLHITFSHDDYAANVGGVQLCVQREGLRLAELGWDHLHVHPAAAWPVVRTADAAGPLGVLLNGKALGVFSPADVAAALAKVAADRPARRRSFAIHSMLGHGVDQTCAILEAAGLKAGYFWLHDFASLCAGYHLLRNDVQDCAAPPPESQACGICVYGPWRALHLTEHQRLFQRLDLTVVSPSQPALDLWRGAWSFPTKGEAVLPHVRLTAPTPAPAQQAERPFRLAFVGAPTTHKGWAVFRALVLNHADDPRYSFHHLASATLAGLPLDFRRVSVSARTPLAMRDAVEALQADAVLVWSLCRETFSFAAHESAAAGAAVITNPDSGNVAAFVAKEDHGVVLPDEEALAAAFESGDILKLGRGRRKPLRYDLEFSALTLDLLKVETGA